MYEHQDKGYKFMRRVDNPILCAEQRLGKSYLTSRDVKNNYNNEGDVNLILAPKSAFEGWEEALNFYSLSYVIITGSYTKKQKLLKCKAGITITNYDTLKQFGWLCRLKWTTVVFDELLILANYASDITQVVYRSFNNVERKYGLTGNPAPKNYIQLYSQMRIIEPKIFKEKNFWEWQAKYFRNYGYKPTPTIRGQKYIDDRLAKYCYFIPFTSVTNLKVKKIQILIRMPKQLKDKYTKLKKEYMLETEEVSYEKKVAGVLWAKLKLLSSGIFENHVQWYGKLDATVSLIKKLVLKKEVPIVLWAHNEIELIYLHELLKLEKIKSSLLYGKTTNKDREIVLKNFNNKDLDVMLVQPSGFKYGSNFSVSNTVIYFSQPAGPDNRDQSEFRTITVAKQEVTTIYDIITVDTVDEKTYNDNQKAIDRKIKFFKKMELKQG